MKNIRVFALLSLFAANGMSAMDKYAEECPMAHSKLSDIRQMLIQDKYYTAVHRIKVLLPEAYAEFYKECIEEAKKIEKEAMIKKAVEAGAAPEVLKALAEDPKSVTLQ